MGFFHNNGKKFKYFEIMADIILDSPISVFKDYVKEFGHNKARRLVYEYFLDRYYKPSAGFDESLLLRKFNQIQIGRIYTYTYTNPIYKDVLDFYDKRPTLLVLNAEYYEPTKHFLITGINLNFIPLITKLRILEIYQKSFRKMITADINRRTNQTITLTPVKPLIAKQKDFYRILNYIFKLVKPDYHFAIRRYWWLKMNFIQNIDYDDWTLLPLLETRDVVGATISEIHSNFMKQKNK